MTTLIGVLLILYGLLFTASFAVHFKMHGGIWLEARPVAEKASPLMQGFLLTLAACLLLGGMYILAPLAALCGKFLP